MTYADMLKVARIMRTADHWCSNCAGDLFNQMRSAFPDMRETIDGVYADKTLKDRLDAARDEWEESGSRGMEPQVWTIL